MLTTALRRGFKINGARTRPVDFQYYFLFSFFVTLALPNQVNLVFLILTSLSAIFLSSIKSLIDRVKNDRLFQLIAIYFLFVSATYIRDHDPSSFLSAVERRFPIVILPLVFGSIQLSDGRRMWLLRGYILSVSISILASLITVYNSVYWNSFNLKYFSWELTQHTIIPSNYLAMYAGFALAMVASDWGKWKLFGRYTGYFFSLFFFSYLLIGGARMPFAATMVALLFLGVFSPRPRVGPFRFLPSIIVLLAFLVSVIFVPYLNQKFANIISKDEPRYIQFEAAIELIPLRPILGYGPQEAEDALVKQYNRMGFESGVRERFNAHNEFLHTSLVMGIPGCILLLAILVLCFRRIFKLRKFLPLAFFLILAMMMMIEVMLLRGKGIIFFASFLSLFLFLGRKQEEQVDAYNVSSTYF